MILLDTNVLSEFMRPKPDPKVRAWLSQQSGSDVYISSITEAELRYGLAILSTGKRRSDLLDALNTMLIEDFQNRILPFDSRAAVAYADIAATCRQAGHPISQSDAQIVAIAHAAGAAALATRNIKDFQSCAIPLINPWSI